ncbi:MAG TPA: ABC transporter substrate-binding protein [Chloroflexota bacterium]|nr:ABC transporter substrate-binding protein [Chloroflexota bacterium]
MKRVATGRRTVLAAAGTGLVGLVGLAGLAACGRAPAGAPAGAGRAGGVLAASLGSEPATLDPQVTSDAALAQAAPFLFDTLLYREVDGRYTPHLAERWETAPDGKAITFTLRQGVRFHDDTPVDAAAVVKSFERLLRVGSRSPIIGDLRRASAIAADGERGVRFTLSEPSATLLNALSQPYAGIVSPAAAEKLGEGFARAPVGSGPFVFKSWQSGAEIALGRNAAYAWGPSAAKNKRAPYLDGVRLRILPDAATQVAALQAGELDTAYVADGAAAKQLRSDGRVALVSSNIQGLIYLGYNMRRAPVDQLAVRQAIAHAIDKTAIAEAALDGMAQPAAAPLPPSIFASRPEVDRLERKHDPQAAKSLLVGKTVGPLTLLTSTSAANGAMATLIQAQLRAVGLEVRIQQLDTAAVTAATPKGEFDLLLWRYDWKDPDALALFLMGDKIGGGNRVFYANPKVDALLTQGQSEMDQEKRARIYVEAQQLILNDLPWHPLVTPVGMAALRKDRVQDVRIELQGKLLLNDARLVR